MVLGVVSVVIIVLKQRENMIIVIVCVKLH